MTLMSTVVHVNPVLGANDYIASTKLEGLSVKTQGSQFIDELDEQEADIEWKTKKIGYGIIIHNRMSVIDHHTGQHPHVFAIMPIEDEYLENEGLKKHIRFKISDLQFARLVYEGGNVTKIYIPKINNRKQRNVFDNLPLAAIAQCYFSNREGCDPQVERLSNRPSNFDMKSVDARISYYSKAMFDHDLAELNKMVPYKKKKFGQKVVDGAVDNCLVS